MSIWKSPGGIPGVVSPQFVLGPALAQLFPHILLGPGILIVQPTVAGLPTQDRTLLSLLCSVPALSLSIRQLPADRRGTAVQETSDLSCALGKQFIRRGGLKEQVLLEAPGKFRTFGQQSAYFPVIFIDIFYTIIFCSIETV